MGCAVSCVHQTTMALFGKNSNLSNSDQDAQIKLERKLYLAKESPEADFDLSDCQLRKVPSGIFSICKVYRKEYLFLNENYLHSLDDGGQLSDLYLLKVLNLSHNKFTHLPSDIKYLVNLRELYVQDNQLKNIPEEIEYLQNLQILDVSQNSLKKLTPLLGKLKMLRKLNITANEELNELCPEICLATNITLIELDCEKFVYPPPEVVAKTTVEIMQFLCNKLNIEYVAPSEDLEVVMIQSPTCFKNDPFVRRPTITWEEQEAAITEQENKMHEAAKERREKFLTTVIQDQLVLDTEILKVQEARETERQKLLKAIQEDELEIACLVANFIESERLNPEIVQQQLAHEQAEHDRLLEITRQNYDNLRKADVMKAMETLIKEDYYIQHSIKNYENSNKNLKHNVLMEELEGMDKLQEFIKTKDESRSVLVGQLLEDHDVQKAIVASLVERTDARSWSLNQEIALISSHLAKLSIIEQEKKKLQLTYNYNELLHQRTQLVTLLDDLLDQQSIRRKQLIDTLKEMEQNDADKTTDFWLRNYQKLLDSAPKSLLSMGKQLDPQFAIYLLQEGVIHCLPFLVKFLFSEETSLLNLTSKQLKESGVSLATDRDGILRAINYYVGSKSQQSFDPPQKQEEPSLPVQTPAEEPLCTGVVSSTDVESSTMQTECVICMDEKCEVVFIPCGHMCCCQECANKELDCCPMCRGSIERKIKVVVA